MVKYNTMHYIVPYKLNIYFHYTYKQFVFINIKFSKFT